MNHEKEMLELKHTCKQRGFNETHVTVELAREASSGHFVRMYTRCISLTNAFEWSHGHEESEWSLMMSLMRFSACRGGEIFAWDGESTMHVYFPIPI